MATSIISNTITGPGGTALEGVPIIIRLVPRGAFRISDGSEVAPVYETTTNASGVWSATLEENANIEPANSYYEVEQQLTAAQGGPRKYTFEVGAGDATLAASLISPINDLASSNYITQAAADLRYLPLAGGFGTSSDMVVSRPGDEASAGVLALGSRADHVHGREEIYGTAADRAALTGDDLFNGLLFHESDTSLSYLRLAGAWVLYSTNGAWLTWTPTLAQGASTNISKTINRARYMKHGRTVSFHVYLVATGAGTAGSSITISLPFTAQGDIQFAGGGSYSDSGTNQYQGIGVTLTSGTVMGIVRADAPSNGVIGTDPNIAVANNDVFWLSATYEATT